MIFSGRAESKAFQNSREAFIDVLIIVYFSRQSSYKHTKAISSSDCPCFNTTCYQMQNNFSKLSENVMSVYLKAGSHDPISSLALFQVIEMLMHVSNFFEFQ